MKPDKELIKAIERLVKESFTPEGKIIEKNVKKCVQVLKSLPLTKVVVVLPLYLKGLQRQMRKSSLKIETSYPLPKGEIERIVKMIGKEYNVFDVENTVDTSLLGGMRVKIGDVVYDDTVGRKIIQIREAVRD